MKKNLIYILILFGISCNSLTGEKEIAVEDKETVNKFIQNYIIDKSRSQEYADLQKTFNCYYKNAVSFNRRNYVYIDTTLGGKYYGLDSLIIFNANMDSAIAFFVRKIANNNTDGFQFYAEKLFAYKNSKGWRIYDGCGTAVYDEKKYSYSMARNNERLWLASDGKWLLKYNNEELKENPNFIQHACNMWCGPCADTRDSLNMNIYYNDIKENTPSDNLYNCR